MRIARRTALLVVVGLVMTLAFAPAWHVSGDNAVAAGASGGAALVASADSLQEAAARLERDQRREAIASQRWAKQPLLLFALVSVLLSVSGLAVRRARRSRQPRPALTSQWFRSGGRAPPQFQLAVV